LAWLGSDSERRLAIAGIVVVSVLLAGFLAWAALTDLPRRAVAEGEFLPPASLQAVRSTMDGVIARVVAHEGQSVAEGDAMFVLAGPSGAASLAALRRREAEVSLTVARLRGFALHDPVPFDSLEVADRFPDLAAEQAALLDVQETAWVSGRHVIEIEIERQRARLTALRKQQRSLKRQLADANELRDLRETLLEEERIGRDLYVAARLDAEKGQERLDRTRGQLREGEEALAESEGKLIRLDARLRTESIRELVAASGELARLRAEIGRLEEQAERLRIDAPAAGVVAHMIGARPGAAVEAGAVLAEIAPAAARSRAVLRVYRRDAPLFAVGRAVSARRMAVDYQGDRTFVGTVLTITPAVFEDPAGRAYHRAVVELTDGADSGTGAMAGLVPGARLRAIAEAPPRTVLEYVLGRPAAD